MIPLDSLSSKEKLSKAILCISRYVSVFSYCIRKAKVSSLGFARLELQGAGPYRIWDTPKPPILKHLLPSPLAESESGTFFTITLRDIYGITFLCALGEIAAVHAHTAKAPYAMPALQSVKLHRDHDITWVYLPIPPKDRITAFGIRQRSENSEDIEDIGESQGFGLLVSLLSFTRR